MRTKNDNDDDDDDDDHDDDYGDNYDYHDHDDHDDNFHLIMMVKCFLPPCAPSASWQISPHAAPLQNIITNINSVQREFLQKISSQIF